MLKSLLIFISINFYGGFAAIAQSSAGESNLKAAFVYNFTKYIDWGENEVADFSIGIIGTSPVENALQEIADTKTVDNKRIVIKHFDRPGDITFCNVLFISADNDFALAAILDEVKRGTLTVSEEPGFARRGTAFNFVVVNHKLKFEANVKSIFNAGLKASSQLLKLAKIVDYKS